MARARASRNQPQSRLSEQVEKTLREGALAIFVALAIILWYALFTYDSNDPGFSQAGSSAEINNGVGRFGALLADLLFNLFGRPAYLFTVMVFYFGWMIFRDQKTSETFSRAEPRSPCSSAVTARKRSERAGRVGSDAKASAISRSPAVPDALSSAPL